MTKTKTCTHCLEEIPSEKKICPHCKAIQFGLFKKYPLLTLSFCIIVFIVCGYNLFSNPDSNNSSPAPIVKQSEPSDIEIGVEAQMQITKMLKSPSTAKFNIHPDIKKLGDKRYSVSSYVDSQNGFGAMIRSTYTVDFTYVDEDRLNINRVVFDGKEVVNNLK